MSDQPLPTDAAADDASPEQGGALEKVVRIGQLMDLYGPLLTDRQRLFVQMHYEEDLSFGEIARQHNVSRQAIHDAVKHAEQALEEYEGKLGLLRAGVVRPEAGEGGEPTTGEAAAPVAAAAPAAPIASGSLDRVRAVAVAMRDLHDKLRRSGGIIYNAEGITRDLGVAAEELEAIVRESAQ